ncbi:MAG: DUF3526 domain-containing protein, partial [Myxococcota bacterium]
MTFRRLFATQCKRWFRQRGVWIALVAFGLLQLGTLYSAWLQQQRDVSQVQTEQRLVREQWENQPDRHPHRVAHYGYFARRIPSALSFFEPGVSRLTGHSIYLEAHHQNPANFAAASMRPVPQHLAWLDPATLFRIILPLFMIFIGFSVSSAERESGTRDYLRTLGVRNLDFLLAKLASVAMFGALLVAPTLLIGAATLVALALGDGASDLFVRAGFLLALNAVWIILVAGGVVLVSDRAKTSRGSLGVLVATWVVLALVVPRVTATVGSTLHPAPSAAEFQRTVHAETLAQGDSHNPNDPKFLEFRRKTLEEYDVSTIEELPVNYGGLVMAEGEKTSSQIYQKHLRELRRLYRAQNDVTSWAALLDPFVAVQQLSMSLAGTDQHHEFDFADQAEAYRFSLVQKLNELHTKEIAYKNDRAQRLSTELYRQIPGFEHRAPSWRANLSHGTRPFAGLMLWVVALGVALIASTPRQ